jgi:predicted Zn-dependent protease
VPERHTTLGIIRYYARDYAGATQDMARALSLAASYNPATFGLGRIAMAAGRIDDAIRYLEAVTTGTPDNPVWLAHLGMAYALAHRDRDVRDVLARLRSQEAEGRFISIDNYAYIAANQGRLDEAFPLLEEAVNRRMTNVLWLAVDPRADAMRADPRFAQLVSRMGVVSK